MYFNNELKTHVGSQITDRKIQFLLTNKYDDAKEAVTIDGIDVANTSPIMGLATDIKPIPPVANKVDVENNSQN